MYAVSNRNRDIDPEDGVGACRPADPVDTWPSCHPAGLILPITSEPSTHSVPWSAFTDGLPSATTDGSDILALQWSFDWNDALPDYDAQLTIDDLEFYTAGTEPTAGSGGVGGSGSGGTAGSGGTGGSAGSGGADGSSGSAMDDGGMGGI
jgi:uncharacterized membrane protein YgcG